MQRTLRYTWRDSKFEPCVSLQRICRGSASLAWTYSDCCLTCFSVSLIITPMNLHQNCQFTKTPFLFALLAWPRFFAVIDFCVWGFSIFFRFVKIFRFNFFSYSQANPLNSSSTNLGYKFYNNATRFQFFFSSQVNLPNSDSSNLTYKFGNWFTKFDQG